MRTPVSILTLAILAYPPKISSFTIPSHHKHFSIPSPAPCKFVLLSSLSSFRQPKKCAHSPVSQQQEQQEQQEQQHPTIKTSDDGTILTFQYPTKKHHHLQKITLIGTAHISSSSIEQVKTYLTRERPDVIFVELDTTRLERLDLTESDLTIPFVTADDITYREDENQQKETSWWWLDVLENAFLDVVAIIARYVIRKVYENMEQEGGLKGGGEFLTAIECACKEGSGCERLVLGDRDSVVTIRRAAELAMRNGNPMDVFSKWMKVNSEELAVVIRDRGGEIGNAKIQTEAVEVLRTNSVVRERLFGRLEREVPEFTKAFVTERDYIMAEGIRRELEVGDARHVVAVVGVAHVAGIANNLMSERLMEGEK